MRFPLNKLLAEHLLTRFRGLESSPESWDSPVWSLDRQSSLFWEQDTITSMGRPMWGLGIPQKSSKYFIECSDMDAEDKYPVHMS